MIAGTSATVTELTVWTILEVLCGSRTSNDPEPRKAFPLTKDGSGEAFMSVWLDMSQVVAVWEKSRVEGR